MPYRGADIDSRITPSNHSRILRENVPLRPLEFPRPELLADVMDRAAKHLRKPYGSAAVLDQVEQWYLRIGRRHVVAQNLLRNHRLVEHDAKFHNLRLKYFADARIRVLAGLWEQLNNVAASWRAAALMGITDFSNGADAWLTGGGGVGVAATTLFPARLRPRFKVQPRTYYENESPLHLTPPMLTMVQCLKSTSGADSPPETSLLLIVAPVVKEFGGNLLPQVPVFRGGSVGESRRDVPRRNLLTDH